MSNKTASAKAAAAARLASLTKSLRKLRANAEQLRTSVERNMAKTSAQTYEWVQISLALGRHENLSDALAALGSTLRPSSPYSRSAVHNWYSAGALMREHKLPEDCNGHAVQRISMHKKALARHELLKAVQMIKDHASTNQVGRYVSTRPGAIHRRALRRAGEAATAGEINLKRVRMEMMAALVFAKKHFGDGVFLVALSENDDVLAEVR